MQYHKNKIHVTAICTSSSNLHQKNSLQETQKYARPKYAEEIEERKQKYELKKLEIEKQERVEKFEIEMKYKYSYCYNKEI